MVIDFHTHAFPDRIAASAVAALDQAGPVTLVAAHMGGWRNWQEVPEYLLDTSVYLDTAFTLGRVSPLDDYHTGAQLDMMPDEQFVQLVRLFGSGRVLFGSDSPWAAQSTCIAQVKALPLTAEEQEDILCRNARRLLGLND